MSDFADSKFSPHTRGCSASNGENKNLATVFPAYAGMFPWTRAMWNWWISFPRIRGDVPPHEKDHQTWELFSPHTRGCSDDWGWNLTVQIVFPAYAGMFRALKRSVWS